MDGSQFDALSRRLGTTRSRRGALKALAAAVVTGLVAGREASAQTCKGNYQSCSADGECCSGAVCEWGMCMPGCRIDGAFAHPYSSPAGNSCQVCYPDVSTTTGTPINQGSPCWSGNPYAGATYCQNGVCAPEGPQSCPPLTECHLEGEINPANGLCTSPPAPSGAPCGIGEMCHGGFYSPAGACDGTGHCIAGGSKTVNCAPYKCEGTACADSCASNDDCINGTVCCNGACLTPEESSRCGACGTECESGSVCCDGTCVVLGTSDHCLSCGDACPSGLTCDPVNGCPECHTDDHCTPEGPCSTVACISGVCVSTPIGGTCNNYNYSCSGACGSSASNMCATTVDGGSACMVGSTACDGLPTCNSSADCDEGTACFEDTCCGGKVCVPTCSGESARMMTMTVKSDGPTAGGI